MVKRNTHTLTLGYLIVGMVSILAILGALLDQSPEFSLGLALAPPSLKHIFGFDPYGVDLGYRISLGAWRSLRIAILVVSISLPLSLLLGTFSAQQNGIGGVFRWLTDTFLAFPSLLAAIAIAAFLPRAEASLILALVLSSWAPKAKVFESLIRKEKSESFIEAAKAAGGSTSYITVRHLWPALRPQLLILAAGSMGGTILTEAALSFLGLGTSTSSTSWGQLIAEGRDYLIEAPHLSFFPGLIFLISVLGFNWIAEGLRARYT